MDVLTLMGGAPLLRDSDFERAFAGTIAGLNRALRSSYVVGRDGVRGPVGKMISKVRQFHLEGNRYARDWEIFRLGIFGMQMERLSKVDPPLFASFLRSLKRISKDEYFGFRFEVLTAMMLLQAGVDFNKREAPDFEVVTGDNRPVFIECVSTNLTGPTDKDVAYKILSAIGKKAKKPYCNTRTALFLDFTNVFYRSVEARNALSMESVGSIVEEGAKQTSFGAVCACSMINILDKREYALGFPSIYRATDADPMLTDFLDTFFSTLGVEGGEIEHMVPFSI